MMDYLKDPTFIEEFASLLECERRCEVFLFNARWKNGFMCDDCECTKGYKLSEYARIQCASCKKQFSAKSGTIFHASKIPLTKWFLTFILICTDKGGVSAMRLAGILAIGRPAAARMLKKLRSVMGSELMKNISEYLVLAYETIFESEGKPPIQACFLLQNTEDEQPVFAIISPDLARSLPPSQKPAMTPSLKGSVAGLTALLRKFFLGTYHRCSSKKYLQNYLDEFLYRYKWEGPEQTLKNFFYACAASKREAHTYKRNAAPALVCEGTATYLTGVRPAV